MSSNFLKMILHQSSTLFLFSLPELFPFNCIRNVVYDHSHSGTSRDIGTRASITYLREYSSSTVNYFNIRQKCSLQNKSDWYKSHLRIGQSLRKKNASNNVPTSSPISMEWYDINMIGLDNRLSSRILPVGVGVARVRERIERAKIACREIENFIVSSTLFIVGY